MGLGKTKDTFCRVTESNEWEGETWYHYFLDKPGVWNVLADLVSRENSEYTDLEIVSLSDEEQTTLANLEPGYIDIHWFGELDVERVKLAAEKDLYKGGIRDFAEELFVTFWINRESGTCFL